MEIPVQRPFQVNYIKSGDRHILCTHFKADNSKATLIFLPSVAEEMNRCRVMVAMQARCLAAIGFGVVLVDYFGTGDSEGHFKETDWEIWKSNVLDVSSWLEKEGFDIAGLWGLRMGAMLAVEMSAEYPEKFPRLALWQPVLNGKTYFTQLLRMKMAGQMDRGETIEKPDALREQFNQGESVEIAGYLFNPKLAQQLDQKSMGDFNIAPHVKVDWFEVVREPGADFTLPTQKLHQQWQQQGVNFKSHSFMGEAFWQMHERTLAPELIDATVGAFVP